MHTRTKRIMVAKAGLDSHDRGAKIIARAMRDAGMEVIYTGIRRTPEQIVNDAIEESVDLIGLSILSGAHVKLTSRILELLKEKDAEDIKVILGGPIPKNDIEYLKKLGVVEVYTPGMKIMDIVKSVDKLIET
jgi:methylmalonyl-CoA mutase C-terminal domain/subunit